ncbi:MAG: hypothetical protein V4717_20310 [Bacteroidota bacterium]
MIPSGIPSAEIFQFGFYIFNPATVILLSPDRKHFAVGGHAKTLYETKRFSYIWLMQTYQVNILNPKATKLLQDLADLKLISIKQTSEDNFLKAFNNLRLKAADNPPSLDDITQEVETVRAKRYGKNKG